MSDSNESRISVEDLLRGQHAKPLDSMSLKQLLRQEYSLTEIPPSVTETRYWNLSLLPSDAPLNSNPNDLHYQKHLWKMRELLKDARGLVLDVGCGDARIGAALLPSCCTYVGIDPFINAPADGQFIGAAEDLPFSDANFDTVMFNTSLDHILDYSTAIREAGRVLQPGGALFISTLVWHNNFSLLLDDIHFHHFKQFEIDGVMNFTGFEIVTSNRAPWKTDVHREVLYAKYQARRRDG